MDEGWAHAAFCAGMHFVTTAVGFSRASGAEADVIHRRKSELHWLGPWALRQSKLVDYASFLTSMPQWRQVLVRCLTFRRSAMLVGAYGHSRALEAEVAVAFMASARLS